MGIVFNAEDSVSIGVRNFSRHPEWQLAFDSELQSNPEVIAGLYPCISGKGGAKIRFKLGLDSEPMVSNLRNQFDES
jgi:hypothetical protein